MWILLTKKLPTRCSPPKLAIFWSTEWTDHKIAKQLRKRSEILEAEDWENARKINYKNSDIRIFPREFVQVNAKFMQDMIDGKVHELVAGTIAEESLIKNQLSKGQRSIFEAALIDGCSKAQAIATALGQNISLPDWQFPPIGWYRPNPEYAQFFCYDWEREKEKQVK